jgi:hypothetical protein
MTRIADMVVTRQLWVLARNSTRLLASALEAKRNGRRQVNTVQLSSLCKGS